MTIVEPKPQPPGNMTILEAIARGYLPADVQISNGGAGPNPTLHQALSSGRVSHSTLCSQITFVGGTFATYGGT